MNKYVSNSFDINYAQAWASDQGGFSYQLAQNLIEYLKKNKIEAKKALDLCFGTSEYLAYLSRNGIECHGTETAKSMVEYSQRNYPNIEYKLVKKLSDIPFKGKFDIVSCNHDMVNTLEKFSEWEELFKKAYSALDKNGIFMFDFYTKNKLENWNEVSFEEGEHMDHVRSIKKGMDNKCIMASIYYIQNSEGYYAKTFDVKVEAYFENAQIIEALKNVGFKKVELLNMALEKAEKPQTRNRIHIIASK